MVRNRSSRSSRSSPAKNAARPILRSSFDSPSLTSMMPSSAAFSSCPSSRNLDVGHGPRGNPPYPGVLDSDLQQLSSQGVGVREEHPVFPVFEICVYVTCIRMCLDIDTHTYIHIYIYTYILYIFIYVFSYACVI